MKIKTLLIIYLFTIGHSFAQNNYTISGGESLIHKKSDNCKALNEAIIDAQTNAVIAFGGNVNYLSESKKVELIESKKKSNKKESKTSSSISEDNKFILRNSVSAMVKNISITADTVWLSKNKFKIVVQGKFEVNLNDIGNSLTEFLINTNDKIKIEVIENDCFGHIYKPLSDYINSKINNFVFSNQPWLLGESDFKIEINSKSAVLFDKRFYPNVVIKTYTYNNCQILLETEEKWNKLLDEMINDMYAVFIYKSVK
jgi:hypothetical protein